MSSRIAENPALSPSTHLDSVDYPVWRDALVRAAEDGEAPPDVINLFKSLPRGKYETREAVMRDFGEAARRFATGNFALSGENGDDGAVRDRRDLGRSPVDESSSPIDR